jgi:hypothetical protein
MTWDSVHASFEALRKEHFDRLCRQLDLHSDASRSGEAFAIVSAAAGNVRVFFEHDRGVPAFGLGATADSKPLCSVEEMAQRFPRVSLIPEGFPRLSLDEQRSFVETQWSALQGMFAPEHIADTRKWYASIARALTERYSRGS